MIMPYTHAPDNQKVIIYRGTCVVLLKSSVDGFWRDQFETIYAYIDKTESVDDVNRCGVGAFSLDIDNPLNAACKPHDYAYQSPAYQAFHTRKEADFYLRQLIEMMPGYKDSLTATLFEFLARQQGFRFWENEATNN